MINYKATTMDLTDQQVKQILKSVATLHERQGISYEAAPIKRLLEDLGASVRNVPALEFRGNLFADLPERRCNRHRNFAYMGTFETRADAEAALQGRIRAQD